jgi:hypothetical protein
MSDKKEQRYIWARVVAVSYQEMSIGMVEPGIKKGSVDFTEGFTMQNNGGEWSMVSVDEDDGGAGALVAKVKTVLSEYWTGSKLQSYRIKTMRTQDGALALVAALLIDELDQLF